jgi:hypothetical protein
MFSLTVAQKPHLLLPWATQGWHMNESHSRAIVFLLAAILCVMLFGAGSVLSGFGWMAGIGVVLSVLLLILVAFAKLIDAGFDFLWSIRDEVVSARSNKKPWLWLLIALPAIIGLPVVLGLTTLLWLGGEVRFKAAYEQVPYNWVPLTFLFASFVVGAIENWRDWLHEVPSVVAVVPRKLVELVRCWLMLVCAPFLAPLGRWRSIREAQARGERIGSFTTAASIFGSFLVGTAACFVTLVMTLGIGVAIYMESFR